MRVWYQKFCKREEDRTLDFIARQNPLGVIQQLRGQNFVIFDPPSPCVDCFYTLSVDKDGLFLPPPPHLVHVVIEWPLFNE